MPVINRATGANIRNQQAQESEPTPEAAPDQISRRSAKRPYSALQSNSSSGPFGLQSPKSTKQRRFLDAIRDDAHDVVVNLTRQARAVQSQDALLMDGGGRPLRMALLHGRVRTARYIWKLLAAHQRHEALTYRNYLLWQNAARGKPETVNWLLDQVNLTAATRQDEHRPHNQGLVRALRSAITGGHCANLTALWDRATWSEWHDAVRESFAEAFESGHAEVVQTVLRLCAPEPRRATIEDIIIPMLEADGGLVTHAAKHGNSIMLDALNPFLHEDERAWLNGLAQAASRF